MHFSNGNINGNIVDAILSRHTYIYKYQTNTSNLTLSVIYKFIVYFHNTVFIDKIRC